MTFTQSALLWMAVFALIGASSYVADRKFGVRFYAKVRKWWTPPSAVPILIERGFIVNRSNLARWRMAGFISAVQAFIMIGWRHADPRVELMLFFLITPATFFGFLMGPLYLRFKKAREGWLHKLDEVESGAIDPLHEVGSAARQKFGTIEKWFLGLAEKLGSFIGKKQSAKVATAPSAPTEDPAAAEARARETLRKFTKGGH